MFRPSDIIDSYVLFFFSFNHRFATRAKKIETKAVANEIVSDAVLSRRYKKQTLLLEKQLIAERKRCEEMESLLSMRKHIIIQPTRKIISNRRKTWAPGGQEDEAVADHESVRPLPVPPAPAENRNQMNERLAAYVHEVEFEGLNGVIDASFIFGEELMGDTTGPTTGVTDRTRSNVSFLKTPRSWKNKRDSSPLPPSPMAAIPVDKDKRIRLLETELEELQQFIKVEQIVGIGSEDNATM